MGGGHRPGSTVTMKCTNQLGLTVDFASDEASAEFIFSKMEDAAYFKVGTDYAFVVSPLSGHSDSEEDTQSESSS